MIEIPKFNLSANALEFTSQDELESALEKDGKQRFEEGNYKLKTSNARFHENKLTKSILCAKDSTWFNVAVTLGDAEGKTKDYFVQVPTTKVKYGEKGTLFVFKKFIEFMAAVGEAVNLNNLQKVVEKYFSSEEALKKLNGLDVDVDMGYTGARAEKVGEEFKIVTKAGPLTDDEGEVILLPDFASAKAYAESNGIALSFVEITKLHSAIKPKNTVGWEQ